jgi:GT2 family glycosyltransferase
MAGKLDPPIRVAAVVVTYNRRDCLAACLANLFAQGERLSAIIVVDNASTDGTREAMEALAGPTGGPAVIYHRLEQNLGGAGGFAHGVALGRDCGFDWLWLMDDDVEVMHAALERMWPWFLQPGVVGVANMKYAADGTPLLTHVGWSVRGGGELMGLRHPTGTEGLRDGLAIDVSSFVGFAVSVRAVERIGLPNARLFLHGDDFEFCFRLRQRGTVVLVASAGVVHRAEAKRYESRLVGPPGRRVQSLTIRSLWSTWFAYRNSLWIAVRYRPDRLRVLALIFRQTVRRLCGILFADDHKGMRLFWLVSATWQGLTGRFHNELPQRVLASLGTGTRPSAVAAVVTPPGLGVTPSTALRAYPKTDGGQGHGQGSATRKRQQWHT